MTPEDWQELEAISSAVTAASVVIISGLAAFWAWYRDTERLQIRRFGNNMPVQVRDHAADIQVAGLDGFANIGVTIVNRSLVSSGIIGAGFDFGGQTYWFREPEILDERYSLLFRQRQALTDLVTPPVPLGRKKLVWPLQVPAKGRVTIWAGQLDLRIMSEGGVSIADIFHGDTAAVAKTESGKVFLTRPTLFGKMRGELRQAVKEMKTPKTDRFTFDIWNDDRGRW